MQTLREKRKQVGLSAESVADIVVTTPTTISQIERGHVTASRRIRNRVEAVLGSDICWDKTKSKSE